MERFLQGQINKYCAAFEHVLIGSSTEFINFERTKMMIMLLRVLRWLYEVCRKSLGPLSESSTTV